MAELDRLRLTQILSPAFPIGAFAHSQGLEWAIASGEVASPDDVRAWIEAVLRQGSGRADAVFLSMARRPDADMAALAELYAAYLPSAERAVEAAELGRGFATLVPEVGPGLPYVLALGRTTAGLAVPEAEVLALFLQGLAAQLVSVAVRFLPMGQSQGQAILAGLAPTMAAVAAVCCNGDESLLGTFTFGADLASMAHETQEIRIFRT